MNSAISKALTIFFLASGPLSHLFAQNFDLNKARVAYQQGKYDSAITYYSSIDPDPIIQLEVLLTLWKKGDIKECLDGIAALKESSNDQNVLIKVNLLKGKVLFSAGQPQASVDLMDSLLGFVKDPKYLGELHNTKSKSLIWVGETGKAILENKKADSIYRSQDQADPILLGNIYNVDGILSYFNGDFDLAITKFEAAIEAKKMVLATTHPDIISLFGNTGVMYKNKLEYDKALQYYGYELENYARSIGEDHLDVSTSYQNIGSIYLSKSEYDLALQAMNKALEIRQKKLGEDNPLTLDIYEWIGNIQASQNDYQMARSTFRKVLDGRIKHLGENSHFVSLAYYNIAEADYNLKNYENALLNFEKAAKIGEHVYSENNYDLASNYNGIAMSLDELGQHEEARRYYFKALEESIPGYVWNGNSMAPPEIATYLRFDEVFASLLGLANSFQRTKVAGDMKAAIGFINVAKNLLNAHKRNFTIKSDKITIARSAKKLADLAIVINYSLFEIEKDESYLSAIFEWSEYVKGTTLLSTISDNLAMELANIPNSLVKQELKFRTEKDSLKTLIASGEEDKGSSKLQTALLNLENQHQNFIESLEKDYPIYSEKKYGLKPLPISEIMVSIDDPGKAIIQYFVTKNQTVFISIIRKEFHKVIVIDSPNLTDQVIALRNAISALQELEFQENALAISKSIFEPIKTHLKGVSELTIIPDGILGYVPFELLKNSDDTYLFESYLIRYELSSTLVAQRKDEEVIQRNLLAYAPVFEDGFIASTPIIGLVRSEDIVNLPGATKEVENIQNVIDGEIRIGMVATETSFRMEADQFDILHLATHSIINERDPSFTKLIFSKSDQDDGQLHIYELENIKLNAKLVTLSACNTGVGKIAEGEGIMSLARSFRSIGVPSVIMSLWPASDASTPELMKYFYQNLKDGQTKDVALNNARKQYLATAKGKARHPFYWGGFVLIGDNSPIEENRNLLVWVFPITIILVLIGTLLRRRRKD